MFGIVVVVIVVVVVIDVVAVVGNVVSICRLTLTYLLVLCIGVLPQHLLKLQMVLCTEDQQNLNVDHDIKKI